MFTNFNGRRFSSPSPRGGRQEQQLLLGWNGSVSEDSHGLIPGMSRRDFQAVTYDGDAPLLTCAATGAGKGRSVLFPTLLTHEGPVICVDIKGENYQVTSRRRREMGQQVVVLDPFHLVTAAQRQPESVRSADLAPVGYRQRRRDAGIASGGGQPDTQTDPFWNTTANGLISGLIAHIASYPPKERHLGQLRAWLYHDDMDMAIAKMLDDNAVKSRMARDQFVAYLAAPHATDAAVHPDDGVQLCQPPGQRAGGGYLAGILVPVAGRV